MNETERSKHQLNKKGKCLSIMNDLDEDLQQLIRPLLNVSVKREHGNGGAVNDHDTDTRENEEQLKLQLFEEHIGPYQEVLDSASALITKVVSDEIFYFETSYDRGFDRWWDPFHRHLEAPRPDVHVYVGLFNGAKKEQESRRQEREDDESGGYEGFLKVQKEIDVTRQLPILELARNILTYLAAQSAKSLNNTEDLLRFCCMYGLSGAAKNVLEGKYGQLRLSLKTPAGTRTLTVNTPLLSPRRNTKTDRLSGIFRNIYMPAMGFAVALGHRHVVSKLIELGADLQQPLGIQPANSQSTYEEFKGENIGAVALRWAILTKQLDMVKYLAIDCGVQFRWLSGDDLKFIFEKLFNLDGCGDEYSPLWLPITYDQDRYTSMRDTRRYRAKCCYEEKQQMLRAVIDAGMPRDLFLPAVDVSIDHQVMQDAKYKGMDEPNHKMLKVMALKMTRRERMAREFISGATISFNSVTKKIKQKSSEEFYDYCLNLWKEQEQNVASQESLLDKFEEADPRWRIKRENKKGYEAFQPWWEAHNDEWGSEEEDFEDRYDDVDEMEQATGLKLIHSDSSEDGLSSDSEGKDRMRS